jgi:biopolymer transport protein ExbD
MQLRRRPSEHAEVAAESMNDIMFFLMLFFLIISTLANPNVVQLALPVAKASKQMNKQPVVVSAINEEGIPRYYIGNDKNAKIASEEELESRLKAEISKAEDATIVLRIDHSLTVKDLKEVLAVGEKLKIKMVMATTSAGS